ncbi:MAG: hypothetical protein IPM91_03455 [Bacteroidetes bacterium]|nr:hypothetical protein [Bacteroidota bacterium]
MQSQFHSRAGLFLWGDVCELCFTVAVSVAVFIAHYLFSWEQGTLFFLIMLTIVLAALAPYTFRTSRAIWLNFFIKYDPELRKKVLKGS